MEPVSSVAKPKRARSASSANSTIERVAVLESRMDYQDAELRGLQATVNANFRELKESLAKISNRKNAVVEFISENWKVLLLFGAVFLGKDVSEIVHYIKALGG